MSTAHSSHLVPGAGSDFLPALAGAHAVELLNRGCYCISLDQAALAQQLTQELGANALPRELLDTHPHLFAPTAVFVSRHHLDAMARIVAAIDEVTQLPAWRERVLAWAPEVARHAPGPRGGLLGIDFHLGEAGPRVIEINTNPGGMLLNTLLCRAQKVCCREMDALVAGPNDAHAADSALWHIFETEWRLQRGSGPLRTVVIVDEMPEGQYLYPEFLLFKHMFERHGVKAWIADPAALVRRNGGLWLGDVRVDLVYNRLTDFALAGPAMTPLRQAYLGGEVVVTPHPHAHALYADKRNLTLLSDATALQELGASAESIATLVAGVPRTEMVVAENAARLWQERRQLFFKPAGGFGSKAAYRGDKLTKRVWDEILAGAYVAQALVRPSERLIGPDAASQTMKLDVRSYAYEGRVVLTAARTYQGQTTNFRTPGGGFAPVFTESTALHQVVSPGCSGGCQPS